MNREESLQQIASGDPWDVLIIGGGATGLGAALEATTRGYRTLLVEQADFAQATSSRSTKLIHGGVRYLAQGDLQLVREALHERARLLQNAPELVHPLALALPVRNLWERFFYGAGLKLYDLLAGRQSLPSARYLGGAQLTGELPGFRGQAQGAWLLQDGQFDDAALALAIARTAAAHGATLANHCRVVALTQGPGGQIRGAQLRDELTGREHAVSARVVINATGVFTDEVQRLAEPSAPPSVTPSRGIHLVLPATFLPGRTAILLPKTTDGRVLFAIPWLGRVLLGTTDAPAERASLEPLAEADEVRYLIDHARQYLGWEIAPAQIISVFAGLRPLVHPGASAATAKVSRDHVIRTSPTGLVNIYGGKWTTYRLMGEQVIQHAAEQAQLPERPSRTARLPLQLAEAVRNPLQPPSDEEVRDFALVEMACTVSDVLVRRTRLLLLDPRRALAEAQRVAAVLAATLGRPEAWSAQQVQDFAELVQIYLPDRLRL